MGILSEHEPVWGTCKNCHSAIVGDADDSAGFCNDVCWEEWLASVRETEREASDKKD